MELQEIVKRSQPERYVLPDIINSDYGLIDLSKFGMQTIPQWGKRKSNPSRRATLKISTFRGISSNAIHYYGTMELQGIFISTAEDKGKPAHNTMAVENKFFPQLEYSHTLKLRRPVTEEDKKADKEAKCEADIRFDYYEVGDLTDRFDKIWDLVSFAKIVFDARLKGSWELFVAYSWANTPIPINELSFNKFE